jgi:hypothetical protein
MVRAARVAYLVLSWAFVAGLLVQVFLIGMGIFGEPSMRQAHAGLGWILHLVPVAILAAAYFARAGSRHWQWALALAIVVFIFPILATMRESAAIAALHPVGATVAFVLSVVVAINAWRAYRGVDPEKQIVG